MNPFSKSLPSSRGDPDTTDTSYYSAMSEWEVTNSVELSRTGRGKKSTKSKDSPAGGGDSSTSTLAVHESGDLDLETSDESIKRITDSSHSSDGLLFYSCFKSTDEDSTLPTDLENSVDFPPELFRDDSGRAKTFRTFRQGQTYKLIILDHFLYEVDPSQKDAIIFKWDLKSLKSIRETKVIPEAETVEINLSFDTLRKQWREKSFIMTTKDFQAFDEVASTFLQARTLQEFDGYQCVKCNSQFSKGMAKRNIVEIGKVPKEVPICPYCQSEFLIILESIPLPNNESISIDEGPSAWGSIRTSTPVSGM